MFGINYAANTLFFTVNFIMALPNMLMKLKNLYKNYKETDFKLNRIIDSDEELEAQISWKIKI
jgi:hypothetical protein